MIYINYKVLPPLFDLTIKINKVEDLEYLDETDILCQENTLLDLRKCESPKVKAWVLALLDRDPKLNVALSEPVLDLFLSRSESFVVDSLELLPNELSMSLKRLKSVKSHLADKFVEKVIGE